jgi:phosphatidylserine decarboxylase
MKLTIILWAINIILSLAILFYLFWKFWFLRDPERKIPEGDVITSPADGKIIKIVDLDNINNLKIKKGLVGKIKTTCSDVGKSCYLVSIFMNLCSVHIQRAPYHGEVISVKHKKGTLGVTTSFKNGLYNEKTETLIKTKKLGKIKVIQIAGFIVNRIENWMKPGDKVKTGDRIGLINFGSQVSIIIPKKRMKLMVKEGQKVNAGISIIAKITKK